MTNEITIGLLPEESLVLLTALNIAIDIGIAGDARKEVLRERWDMAERIYTKVCLQTPHAQTMFDTINQIRDKTLRYLKPL